MPKYVLAYHGGGMPESEEEQARHMAAWESWMSSGAFLDRGAPTMMAMTVSSDGSVNEGGGSNPLSGYGIIEADDMGAAVEIAKGCPIVTMSEGTVEVAETFEIPGM